MCFLDTTGMFRVQVPARFDYQSIENIMKPCRIVLFVLVFI